MTAGYSGTPLVKKLGLKEAAALAIVGAPPSFVATLGPLPAGARESGEATQRLDFVLLFAHERAELERAFPRWMARLQPDGMLWVAWPKKASGLRTDLSDRAVREVGLNNGLVDTKVCAVDATWSGLKFVFRVADRPAVAQAIASDP